MNINCEIMQDLLPLYEDGVCSPSSREAVEAHLRGCNSCRKCYEESKLSQDDIVFPQEPFEKKPAKSFRKVRRRWITSLLVVALLVPVLAMSFNQIRGDGICFTNLDDILTAQKFVNHIERDEYEKAAAMYDFSIDYSNIIGALSADWESYMPNFQKVSIGTHAWYINSALAGEVNFQNDEEAIWSDLIFNHHYGVLVPIEQMKTLAQREPDVTGYGGDGYTVNGQTYLPLDTPWGTFLAEQSAINAFVQSDAESLDYGHQFSLIPEQMYLDILPAMQHDARQLHTSTQRLYGAVSELTADTFCAMMQQRYSEQLDDVFSDYTVLNCAYVRSYRTETVSYPSSSAMWRIGIQCTLSGIDYPVTFFIDIHDGKVFAASASYPGELSRGIALTDAIHPSYLE